MSGELWGARSIAELRRAVASGEVSPARILADCRRRAREREPRLNAWRHLPPDDAPPWRPRGDAASGDLLPTGNGDVPPLAGVPVALKANLGVPGWPLDCGSRLLAGYAPPFAAAAARFLAAAGAVVVGLTNMDEFAMGSSGEYSAFGPTANPWDPGRVPGGSSSGAAAAVADGQVTAAVGTDTGGSLRQPAHCCGLVGWKPAWGGVSRYGLVPFASSLDTVGVLARRVRDAAAVAAVIARRDPRDATCTGETLPPDAGAVGGPAGLRLGIPAPDRLAGVDAAVREALAIARGRLEEHGVRCAAVDLPPADRALDAYTLLAAAEAFSNLLRYDGTLTGRSRGGDDYRAVARRARGEGFGPEVKRRLLLGAHVLSAGSRRRTYDRAVAERRRWADRFRALASRCDALLLPVMDTPAFPLGERTDDPVRMHRADRWTVPASLAGLPALVVPVTLAPGGLPVGVQLVATGRGSGVLFRLGAALEAACGFPDREEWPWRRR